MNQAISSSRPSAPAGLVRRRSRSRAAVPASRSGPGSLRARSRISSKVTAGRVSVMAQRSVKEAGSAGRGGAPPAGTGRLSPGCGNAGRRRSARRGCRAPSPSGRRPAQLYIEPPATPLRKASAVEIGADDVVAALDDHRRDAAHTGRPRRAAGSPGRTGCCGRSGPRSARGPGRARPPPPRRTVSGLGSRVEQAPS